jgi:hypothetical protein
MQILKWQILILGIGFFGSCILYAVLYIQAEQRKDRENAPPTELFIRTRTGEPVCPYCARTDQIRQYQYGLTREAPPEGMISGGCGVGPDSPEYKCLACGTRFGKTTHFNHQNQQSENEK